VKEQVIIMVNLKGRDILKMSDLTSEEVFYLLDLAADLKSKKKSGISVADHHPGKNIALIFEKTSTRTRCSFEVAAHDLGMHVTYLDPEGSQIGWKESIADTARVLAGMFDGIEYRGFEQTIVEELAYYSKVPVWNGLTNESHPTQMFADLLTIREHFGHLEGLTLCYMGDARLNTGNSLMMACALVGMNCVICAPEKYQPAPEIVEKAREIAEKTGAEIIITDVPQAASKGADIVYTDVWVSLGEPEDVWKERIADLSPYRVDKSVMENAGPDAIFMHCLPSFHDLGTRIGREIYEKYGLTEMEVTDEVFESANSLVFVEAENRMHTIKAIMDATL
jgi:ornithine carbamoyltransferase